MTVVRGKDRLGKISMYHIPDDVLKNISDISKIYYGVCDLDTEDNEKRQKLVRIISKPYSITNEIKNISKISRITDEEENRKIEELDKKSKEDFQGIKDTILEEKNEEDIINILDCFYDFFDGRLVILYYSPQRVDFRNIVKRLARDYKARIEMRQLNDREFMSYVGGIGECGRILCCKLKSGFPKVTISMAKAQNMNPRSASILGACGNIKCCIANEYETYLEEKKELPKPGDIVLLKDQKVRVTNVDVISKNITIELKDEEGINIKKVIADELVYNVDNNSIKEIRNDKENSKEDKKLINNEEEQEQEVKNIVKDTKKQNSRNGKNNSNKKNNDNKNNKGKRSKKNKGKKRDNNKINRKNNNKKRKNENKRRGEDK